MKKLFFFTIYFLSGCLSMSLAQQDVEVSDPRISQDGRQISIVYDILNAERQDLFDVNLLITDKDGKTLPARSLEGDVGSNVRGGMNRTVRWNPENDGISLDSYIFVEVIAVPAQPPQPGVNRTSLMLQSLALPGLGLTRYTGKPHWIKGVAAYGCLAGSVVTNRMGLQALEDMDSEPNFDEKVALHDRAISMDQTSEILAYAALGIWVVDLAWTFIGTSGEGKAKTRGLKLGATLDRHSGAGMLSLNYRF